MSLLLGLLPKSLYFAPVWGGGGWGFVWLGCVCGGGGVFLGPFSLWEGLSGGVGSNFCQFGT